jgi:uncharacterized membrane protein
MKKAILELLGSKKVLMAVFTVAAFVGAKLGLNFDAGTAFAAISPLIAAILGQGAADYGKSAALLSQPVDPKQ